MNINYLNNRFTIIDYPNIWGRWEKNNHVTIIVKYDIMLSFLLRQWHFS